MFQVSPSQEMSCESDSAVDLGVAIGETDDEKRARTLVEKKTVLNLVEAFS